MRRASALGIGLFCLGLAAVPTVAHAGAWTPDAGSAYQKLAFNFFRSDASFSAGQDRRQGFKEFTNTNLTYYLEYGIRDGLAFFGSLPAERLTQRTKGRNEVETFGFGDVDLGLRYRLWNRGVVFSTQFLFKAPYLYDRGNRLPLGNGQEDLEGRLLLGRSLGRLGYFGLEGGYRYRRGAPSDEFRYLVEYGFNATDRVYLRAKRDSISAIGNGEKVDGGRGNPQLRNEFDLGKLELTAGYGFTKIWFGEFTFTPNLYGRNTLRGENFQLAVVRVF
jgi:protein XagA